MNDFDRENLRLIRCDCESDEGGCRDCPLQYGGRCGCAHVKSWQRHCPYCEGTMLEIIETLPIGEEDLDVICGTEPLPRPRFSERIVEMWLGGYLVFKG